MFKMFCEWNSVFIIFVMIILIIVIVLYGLKGYNLLYFLVEIFFKCLEFFWNLVYVEFWDCLFRLMYFLIVVVVCIVIYLKESWRIC